MKRALLALMLVAAVFVCTNFIPSVNVSALVDSSSAYKRYRFSQEGLEALLDDMRFDADGIKNKMFWEKTGRSIIKKLIGIVSEDERVVLNFTLKTIQPPFKGFIYDDEYVEHLEKNRNKVYEIYRRKNV